MTYQNKSTDDDAQTFRRADPKRAPHARKRTARRKYERAAKYAAQGRES